MCAMVSNPFQATINVAIQSVLLELYVIIHLDTPDVNSGRAQCLTLFTILYPQESMKAVQPSTPN